MTHCETRYCFEGCLRKNTQKIHRNNEKGHSGTTLGYFRAQYSAQSNFLKKCFKGTVMAISMLSRGKLWKMFQLFKYDPL